MFTPQLTALLIGKCQTYQVCVEVCLRARSCSMNGHLDLSTGAALHVSAILHRSVLDG